MARPKTTVAAELVPVTTDPAITDAVIYHDQAQADLMARNTRVIAVARQMGYQLPADCVDPDLIQRDIAANMRRSVEACLEVGRGLLALKEACGRSEFTARLDILGLDKTVASRFMQAAAKFSKVASTQLLKAAGNQTKLFEMLVLDDEQIEELELTGQTGELKLDDVATMSVKELRAALRESKGAMAAKDAVLQTNSAKINEQAEQIERLKRAEFTPRPESVARTQEQENCVTALKDACNRVEIAMREVFYAADLAYESEASSEALREFATNCINYVAQMLGDYAAESHIHVDLKTRLNIYTAEDYERDTGRKACRPEQDGETE